MSVVLLCRIRKLSDFIENICVSSICVQKMNKGLACLEQHEGELVMTDFSFLDELSLFNIVIYIYIQYIACRMKAILTPLSCDIRHQLLHFCAIHDSDDRHVIPCYSRLLCALFFFFAYYIVGK